MGKPLSEAECKEQYKATLDKVASIVLFQYSFIATINFICWRNLTSFPFIELELSRVDWAFVSNAVAAATTLYVCRHLRYLDMLVRLYPKQRRSFRFLAWNHTWLLNPFGRYRLPFVHLLRLNLLPYMVITSLGTLPGLYFLDRSQLPPNLDYRFWSTWGGAVALATINVYSVIRLLWEIFRHSNTLWAPKPLYFRWGRDAVHWIAGTSRRPPGARPVLVRRKRHAERISSANKTEEV